MLGSRTEEVVKFKIALTSGRLMGSKISSPGGKGVPDCSKQNSLSRAILFWYSLCFSTVVKAGVKVI